MIKKKLITFTFLCVLLVYPLLFSVKALSDSDYQVNTLNNFQLYFPQGNSILFQMPGEIGAISQYVALNPVVGNLNGTSGTVWLASAYGGKFTYQAQEDATLTLAETVGAVRISGGVYIGEPYGSGSNITTVSGSTYTFEWSYVFEPILPISLIMGIIGVCMVFGGSFYSIHNVREREIKQVVNGLIIALIGFALIVGWFYI